MTVVVKLAASTVSEHLSELRKAGLVSERKEGRWVEYRLSAGALRDGTLDAIWPALEDDREAKADAVLVKELRRVPLDDCAASISISLDCSGPSWRTRSRKRRSARDEVPR
jgi:DNA-binding transcriptional ArsR family regulator